MRRPIRFLCAGVCLAVLVFSGYQLYGYWRQSVQSRTVYDDLAQYAEIPEPTAHDHGQQAGQSEIAWPAVDFDALGAVNSDVIGWLYSADTAIDYPVVQGEDNDFYLDHLFDGSEHPGGCLFADFRSADDFSDRHTIIYGHAMKDGSMFSTIRKYAEQTYYHEHPQLLLITPDARWTVEIFSGYVASVQDGAWQLDFADDAAFEAWLSTITQKSAFASAIQPTVSDRILTLSTCSYDFDDARFVVHGVLRPVADEP